MNERERKERLGELGPKRRRREPGVAVVLLLWLAAVAMACLISYEAGVEQGRTEADRQTSKLCQSGGEERWQITN